MVNVETVFYLCAKFHNFLPNGSMGCQTSSAKKKKKTRCLHTIGAWLLIIMAGHLISYLITQSVFQMSIKQLVNKMSCSITVHLPQTSDSVSTACLLEK